MSNNLQKNYHITITLFANDSILRNENKDGPFLTIGISKPESFMFDTEDNILNIKGEIPAVIHQYDRHKKIVIKVLNKFFNNLTEENDDENQIGYRDYNNAISSNLYNISNNKIIIQKGYNNIYLTKNLFLKLYFIFLFISIFLIIFLYNFEKKIHQIIKKNIKFNVQVVLQSAWKINKKSMEKIEIPKLLSIILI